MGFNFVVYVIHAHVALFYARAHSNGVDSLGVRWQLNDNGTVFETVFAVNINRKYRLMNKDFVRYVNPR